MNYSVNLLVYHPFIITLRDYFFFQDHGHGTLGTSIYCWRFVATVLVSSVFFHKWLLFQTDTTFSVSLDQWCVVAASSFPELSITLCSSATQSSPAYLVCTRKTLHDHPPAGLISRVRVVISESGEYELQVLYRSVEKGVVASETQLLQV